MAECCESMEKLSVDSGDACIAARDRPKPCDAQRFLGHRRSLSNLSISTARLSGGCRGPVHLAGQAALKRCDREALRVAHCVRGIEVERLDLFDRPRE